MSLRLKLFIVIGSLFVLLALLSYFLPPIFLAKDQKQLFTELSQEAENKYRHLIQKNHIVLDSYILQIKGEIDSLLYLIDSSANLEKSLAGNPTAELVAPWRRAALLLSISPQIGLIQQTHETQVSACIAIDDIPLYGFTLVPLAENIAWVGMPGYSYLAIRFPPNNFDQATDPEPFYLFEWDLLLKFQQLKIQIEDKSQTLWDSLKLVMPSLSPNIAYQQKQIFLSLENSLQTLEGLIKGTLNEVNLNGWLMQMAQTHDTGDIISRFELLKQIGFSYLGNSIDNEEEDQEEVYETYLRQQVTYVVRQMTYFLYVALGITSPFDANAPQGIIYPIANQSQGVAVLCKDLFFQNRIFDDATYMQNNPPLQDSFPVASSLTLIRPTVMDGMFIGNTLRLTVHGPAIDQQDFFTVGLRLRPLLKNLALSAGSDVLLIKNNQIISSTLLDETSLSVTQILQKDFGVTNYDNQPYMFAKVQEIPQEGLSIIFMMPADTQLFAQIESLLHITFKKISWQLFALATFGLLLALIFLAIISKSITKPIALLADATQKIALGHYDEVILPSTKSQATEISVLTSSFQEMVKGLKDREKIRGILNIVVSKGIADEILKMGVKLGGEEKIASILFADIRGFTHMTETLQPHEVIKLLNEFMTKMSRFVDEQEGVIDKFIGDEIMAIYGAPLPQAQSSLKALTTAIQMIQALETWNKERLEKNQSPITIGIGIHTGPVVAGNMGTPSRLNYTVLGATVNMASRLCDAAKPNQILTSAATVQGEGVLEKIIYKEELPVGLAGFSQEITPYSILGFKTNS